MPTRHVSSTSTLDSTGAPIVTPIVPVPPSPLFEPVAPSPIQLTRPYPLVPTALADLAYTIHHSRLSSSPYPRTPPPITPTSLLVLSGVRAAVLALVLLAPPPTRWRARRGWVAASSGATLLACVWEVCASRLMRNVGAPPADIIFLLITSAIAIGEYIFYLLLVRLAPPLHTPFSLRLPPSAAHSPTRHSFAPDDGQYGYGIGHSHAWQEPTAPNSPSAGRRSAARRARRVSRGTHRSISGLSSFGLPSTSRSPLADTRLASEPNDTSQEIHDDLAASHHEGGTSSGPYEDFDQAAFNAEMGLTREDDDGEGHEDGDEDEFEGDEFEGDEFDLAFDEDEEGYGTESSVSDSSIIDLPRDREPSRIIVAPSAPLSISAGLNLAAAGVERVAGAASDVLVRRSASARFIARSLGSRSDGAADDEAGVGYGTFARA